jgi:ankyrin repeat protein
MRYLSVLIACIVLGTASALAGPLHDASSSGDLKSAAALLDQGADLAEPNLAGEPPLLLAALAGHVELVSLFLDRGADIAARNKGGLTALHAAAYAGKIDVAKLLVAKGASIDDADNFYRMTPLHAAAEEGHVDVVAFLLASKANVEAKERNGVTPLTQAGWRQHWATADVLLKAGAFCQEEALVGPWLFAECTKRKAGAAVAAQP